MEKIVLQNVHITAIVPVYNVENYLEECLNSICNQTDPFDEVILINDGSTDNSQMICEKYTAKYSYFTLINQENAGLSETRNVGLKASNSNYIVFIDSDDCVKKNMVQIIKDIIYEKKYDVLFFGSAIINESGVIGEESYYVRDNIFCDIDLKGIEFFKNVFPSNYIVSACLAVYSRDFLVDNNIFFEKGRYFEDNDFHLRVCIKAQKVRAIHESLYVRRYRNGSIMSEIYSYKKCEDLIYVNRLIWKVLENSDLETKYKIRLISYYLVYTWGIISESEYFNEIKYKWYNLTTLFIEKWLKYFLLQEIDFRANIALYLMLMESSSINSTYINYLEDIKRRIQVNIKKQLCAIPLNQPNKLIGIYGIGKHTEKLFELYRKYIGDIGSKLVFIITEKKQGLEYYQGYPIISYKEIPKDINCIIISSLKFQKDIYEILKKNNISEDKIMKLYNQEDYCDWASIARIIL